MKSKLLLVPTGDMTPEIWLDYRHRGIGASDVGTVLGLNPYKCTAQLFYEKIEGQKFTVETMAQFMGKAQENFIAELWQFWDPANPDEATLMENHRQGRKVRRCQRVNAYVHNPDYPWLFVSLDRKINKFKYYDHKEDGSVSVTESDEGSLELKTIAGYEANKWEGGIPPAYVVQVQTQLFVCEFLFGEMAIFEDGRRFDVLPFDYNPGICDTIVNKTREFWERVKEGRKIKTQMYEAERTFNHKEMDKLEGELVNIEPPPDDSEAYAKYLKERYKIAEPGEMKGTDELLTVAVRHQGAKEMVKKYETEARGFENFLKNSLRDGAAKIDFGPFGYVSWKNDINGTRRFLNKTKSV